MINFFGKKQKKEKEEKKPEKKKKKPKLIKDSTKNIKKRKEFTGKKNSTAWKALHSPLISEKASFLEEGGKYIFKVLKKANKTEIRKAVEDLYGIKVDKVNIINIKRKFRRLGRSEGWKPGYKKAIITFKNKEKIEILPK